MDSHVVVSGWNSSSANSRSSFVPQPETFANFFQQALALHRQNRFSEAEVLYRQILEADPNHPGAMHFLGMLAYVSKDFPKAAELISRSITLCPDKAVYHNNYGVVLREVGNYEASRRSFERALALQPDYPDALSNLGLAHILLDADLAYAESIFESILEKQPNRSDTLQHLATLYIKQKRYLVALPVVEKLVNLNPDSPTYRHQLGCLSGECDDLEKTKTYLQQAACLRGGKQVWNWKHLSYCPTFFESNDQIDEYWANLHCGLEEALIADEIYDWRTLPRDAFIPSFHLPHHDRP